MNNAAIQIIGALGGTAKVSRMFGLSMPSVSGWKETGIPEARMMFLQVAHKDALVGVDLTAATSTPKPAPEIIEPACTNHVIPVPIAALILNDHGSPGEANP